MANEDELVALSNEMQMQQARGESIRQQMQAMQSSLLEMGATIETLENIDKAKKDTLVPIGSGIFLSCPKPDSDRVVVSVGSGMMTEKKPDEAIKILESRMKKVQDAMNAAQAELSKTVDAIDRLTERASQIGAQEERAKK